MIALSPLRVSAQDAGPADPDVPSEEAGAASTEDDGAPDDEVDGSGSLDAEPEDATDPEATDEGVPAGSDDAEPADPATDGDESAPVQPDEGAAGAEATEEEGLLDQEELDRLAGMSLEELLSPQVISASLLREDAWEALAVIGVITQEQLREYGHLSIGDALRFEPGFYPVYDLVNYNVGVRGVNGGMGAQSQVVRTMLEGRDIRFRPTGGSFFGPELIPRLGIRQVELVRGPVSALYGADAFLGAVNVIPNRAADMGPGNARMEVNTLTSGDRWGVQGDGAVWGTPLGIDSVVSLTYRDLDRGGLQLPQGSPTYDTLTRGIGIDSVPVDRERAASGLARFEGSWGDGSLTLDTNFQFFERNANFHYESSPLADGRASLYTFGTTLRFNQTIAEKVRVVAFAGYSRGGPTYREQLVDRLIESTVPFVRRVLDYQTLESRVEVTYTDEIPDAPIQFALTLGGDYLFDNVDLPAVIGIRPEPQEPLPLSPPSVNASYHNGAGFAQLRVRLFERLRVLGGVRIESQSLYGEQTSYRAGVGYADEHLSIRGLYGRSFKAPSLSLLFAEPVISGGPERNPALQAQYAQTGELNVSYRPWRWLTFSVTGFVSEIDAFARINTTGFTPRAENSVDIIAYGGEAEVRFDHSRDSGFEGFVNFGYARTEETQDAITSRSPLYPEATLSAGLQFHLRDPGMRFMILDRFATSRGADPSNIVRNAGVAYDVPLYNVLSVGVYSEGLMAIPGLETVLGLRFDNLLFQNYAEPGFLGVDVPGDSWGIRITVSQQL